MRAPSIASLAELCDGSDDIARKIRTLWFAAADRDELEDLITYEEYPVTWQWARSCYHSPFTSQGWRITMALSAIGELVEGTYGVEGFSVPPDVMNGMSCSYLNTGDTYTTTLLHSDLDPNQLVIGCWGDTLEAMERDHNDST